MFIRAIVRPVCYYFSSFSCYFLRALASFLLYFLFLTLVVRFKAGSASSLDSQLSSPASAAALCLASTCLSISIFRLQLCCCYCLIICFYLSLCLFLSIEHLNIFYLLACLLSIDSVSRVSPIGVPLLTCYIMINFLFSVTILTFSSKFLVVASFSLVNIDSCKLLCQVIGLVTTASSASNSGSRSN